MINLQQDKKNELLLGQEQRLGKNWYYKFNTALLIFIWILVVKSHYFHIWPNSHIMCDISFEIICSFADINWNHLINPSCNEVIGLIQELITKSMVKYVSVNITIFKRTVSIWHHRSYWMCISDKHHVSKMCHLIILISQNLLVTWAGTVCISWTFQSKRLFESVYWPRLESFFIPVYVFWWIVVSWQVLFSLPLTITSLYIRNITCYKMDINIIKLYQLYSQIYFTDYSVNQQKMKYCTQAKISFPTKHHCFTKIW